MIDLEGLLGQRIRIWQPEMTLIGDVEYIRSDSRGRYIGLFDVNKTVTGGRVSIYPVLKVHLIDLHRSATLQRVV